MEIPSGNVKIWFRRSDAPSSIENVLREITRESCLRLFGLRWARGIARPRSYGPARARCLFHKHQSVFRPSTVLSLGPYLLLPPSPISNMTSKLPFISSQNFFLITLMIVDCSRGAPSDDDVLGAIRAYNGIDDAQPRRPGIGSDGEGGNPILFAADSGTQHFGTRIGNRVRINWIHLIKINN